jgi:hypothetical protein
VIKHDGVPLLSRPDPRSDRVGSLSYNIVRFPSHYPAGTPSNVGDEWSFVETLTRRRGWVRDEHVYQLHEYRMGFMRRNGQWLLAYFIAGD